jgi:hypothetical protein
MLNEIELARELGLPRLIITEPQVTLSADLENLAIRVNFVAGHFDDSALRAVKEGIARIDEDWKKPKQPHYAFYSTNFGDASIGRNRVIRHLIQRVTGIRCLMGDDIRDGHIQQVISDLLRHAFLVISDISEENLNTCIEAGIALGARRRLHLISAAPRRRPAFMFRDQQVWHYASEADLIGMIHRIVYPYRRRVLNAELRKRAID